MDAAPNFGVCVQSKNKNKWTNAPSWFYISWHLTTRHHFFLNLRDTCPFLGPLVPLFRIYCDVSCGFQSQSGFCLIRIVEANVWYIPWDPPLVFYIANHLAVSNAPSHFPTCISRGGTWLRFERAITWDRRRNTLPLCPATRLWDSSLDSSIIQLKV